MNKKISLLTILIISLLQACTPARSYQITTTKGKVVLYDKHRKVGEVPLKSTGLLYQLIIFDNQ